MKKKIIPGMRNIKTAIAIFIDLIIFEFIGSYDAFYACVASVVCMQHSVEETVKVGKSRIIGPIIAAIIGLIFFYIGELIPVPCINLILIPIGVILIIQICVMLNCPSSSHIASVVLISILTGDKMQANNIIYPFTRIIETFIGILVATIVNKYIPTKNYKNNP